MGKIVIKVDYTDNFCACPANDDIACVVGAQTFPELQEAMGFSLREHITWMKEDGDPIPAEFEGEWELVWDLSVRAILHFTEGLVSKAALAKATGINQRQLGHYATGYRNPRPAMRAKIVNGLHAIGQQLLAIE